jgi:hypothetical protein
MRLRANESRAKVAASYTREFFGNLAPARFRRSGGFLFQGRRPFLSTVMNATASGVRLPRRTPLGFIEPCHRPARGRVHGIKHKPLPADGRRDPLLGGTIRLKVRSCLIDGEVVRCDAQGVTSVRRLQRR